MKLRCAALFPVLFCGILLAQFPNTAGVGSFGRDSSMSISGRVLNGSGSPAADASVVVTDINSGRPVASAYTNSSGIFSIDGLPNGAFEVAATSGLARTVERVDAGTAGLLTLRLPLDRSAAAGHAGATTISVAEYRVPQKARDALRKAEQAAHKGKTADVDKFLGKALAIAPDYSDALTFRAIRRLTQGGSSDDAVHDLDAALKADAANARAYFVLGAVYNAAQRFDQAIGFLQHGVRLMPNAWQGYYELAKSYAGKADFAASLQQLHRAEDSAPSDFTSLPAAESAGADGHEGLHPCQHRTRTVSRANAAGPGSYAGDGHARTGEVLCRALTSAADCGAHTRAGSASGSSGMTIQAIRYASSPVPAQIKAISHTTRTTVTSRSK